MKQFLLIVAGAVAGGVLGYNALFWVWGQGFYGMVLPGGLLGIGAGAGRNRWVSLAVVCGIAALVMGLFTEWRFRPMALDQSLGYFLLHFYQLQRITLIMIALGGAIGFWVPFRRIESRPIEMA